MLRAKKSVKTFRSNVIKKFKKNYSGIVYSVTAKPKDLFSFTKKILLSKLENLN